jgi:lipoyl(octanoyl) transferase
MKMRASPHTVNILEWKFQEGLVEYLEALKWMETRVKAIQNKEDRECVWLLEHPPLYTLGTSGHVEDILVPDKLPLFKVGRGGQATYHGPGQRMIYLMLDLTTRFQDIRRYVYLLTFFFAPLMLLTCNH